MKVVVKIATGPSPAIFLVTTAHPAHPEIVTLVTTMSLYTVLTGPRCIGNICLHVVVQFGAATAAVDSATSAGIVGVTARSSRETWSGRREEGKLLPYVAFGSGTALVVIVVVPIVIIRQPFWHVGDAEGVEIVIVVLQHGSCGGT